MAGLSAARNAGFQAAAGALIAYLDADAYPSPEWVWYLALGADRSKRGRLRWPERPAGSTTRSPPSSWRRTPGGPIPQLASDDRAVHIPGLQHGVLERCARAAARIRRRAVVGGGCRVRLAGARDRQRNRLSPRCPGLAPSPSGTATVPAPAAQLRTRPGTNGAAIPRAIFDRRDGCGSSWRPLSPRSRPSQGKTTPVKSHTAHCTGGNGPCPTWPTSWACHWPLSWPAHAHSGWSTAGWPCLAWPRWSRQSSCSASTPPSAGAGTALPDRRTQGPVSDRRGPTSCAHLPFVGGNGSEGLAMRATRPVWPPSPGDLTAED